MQFSLGTPEDSKKLLSNATKVKVHLSTGIVEILDKHQDLLGRVGLDLLEIESNDENKTEKLKFLLQDGLVIVSNKGLTINAVSNTGVYVYAKRVAELNSSLSTDEFTKKIEQKTLKLELEKQTLIDATNTSKNIGPVKIRISMLESDLAFDKKVLSLIKESRN
jgi:F0F1-type ATP synthase epsilon subunit